MSADESLRGHSPGALDAVEVIVETRLPTAFGMW
jgi:hypothetical protein